MLRQIPNILTSLRLVAAPILAWLIVQRRFREALVVVLLAGISDGLDGWAARRLKVSSKIGALLDPLADKTMLVTLFLALGYVWLIPFWLLYLVIGRDVIIVVGSILVATLRNISRFTPSMLGKVSTFFQIVFVLLVLLFACFPHPYFEWPLKVALVLTAVFTSLSGADYIRLGIRMARRLPV